MTSPMSGTWVELCLSDRRRLTLLVFAPSSLQVGWLTNYLALNMIFKPINASVIAVAVVVVTVIY